MSALCGPGGQSAGALFDGNVACGGEQRPRLCSIVEWVLKWKVGLEPALCKCQLRCMISLVAAARTGALDSGGIYVLLFASKYLAVERMVVHPPASHPLHDLGNTRQINPS